MNRRISPRKLSADDLRNVNVGSHSGGSFFDTPDFDYEPTIRHLKTVDRLNIQSHSIDAPKGLSPTWQVRFEYHGFDFLVETNHHGTTSSFFVCDANCPSGVLLDLLEIFGQIGPLTWEQPTGGICAGPATGSTWVWQIFIALLCATIIIVLILREKNLAT